jgi:hypothetical protein
MNGLPKVDHAALRTNQSVIIALLVAAFIFNLPWLAAGVGVVMLVGSLLLRKAGFWWVYAYILRPSGLAKPDVLTDNPQPHLFAQGFGGVVLLAAALALTGDLSVLGWALTWLVIALAALNLFGGFCVGCALYYWLNRLNIPGFTAHPPEGAAPGFRPRGENNNA